MALNKQPGGAEEAAELDTPLNPKPSACSCIDSVHVPSSRVLCTSVFRLE